ncbi:Olfactory receptor 5V1 [Heterocephalus glaber]|nr:Olfactory receptor 5V1 [Heterocephalus glaber]
MSNKTGVTEFFLRGFSDVQELRFVVIFFFLFAYLLWLLENISIITAVFRESHLHSQKYFFLNNQSFLDMCNTSVTRPRGLVTSLTGSGCISYLECVVQLYMFITLASTKCFQLIAMKYGWCLANLKPLLYGTTMNERLSSELAAMAWVSRAIYSAFHTLNTFSLPFSRPNILEHFF